MLWEPIYPSRRLDESKQSSPRTFKAFNPLMHNFPKWSDTL